MFKLLLLVAVASADPSLNFKFGTDECAINFDGTALSSACAFADSSGTTISDLKGDLALLTDRVDALENAAPTGFASCQEYYDNGARTNGNYDLHPTSSTGSMITVECHFDANVVWTKIGHNKVARSHVIGCEGPGCYSSGTVNYNAPLDAVKAIADNSIYCRQSMRYECKGSGLWPGAGQYGWWHDRDGNTQNSGLCDSGTCACDANDNVWREDTGTITDKSQLPITQLRYGDTGDAGEEGYHTLSKLECIGSTSNIMANCQQYANAGITANGEYFINTAGNILKVECRFVGGQGTTVIHHSKSNVRESFSGCEAAGCQQFDMIYDVPETQIAAVAATSLSCKQHINYECKGSGLWPDNPYGWWNDKNGAKVGPTWCADNSACNCDQNDNVWRADAGYITDKSKLPISSMNFGDMGDAGEAAAVTVGSMECTGDLASAPTTCAGISNPTGRQNAVLLINNSPQEVVCDFNTGKVELHHNTMSYITNQGIEPPGAGTLEISYAGGIDQAVAFANMHSGCTQTMDYKCYGSGVWRSGTSDMGYNYFVGKNSQNVQMPCSGGVCNECDKNDNTWRDELGGSFSTSELPIRSFKFGDTGDASESNQIRLSAVICNM